MVKAKSRIDIDINRTILERDRLVRRAISDLIRIQRKSQSPALTQESLAGLSDISYEHLNHVENDKSSASLEVLDRIARALGFDRLSEFLALDQHQVL